MLLRMSALAVMLHGVPNNASENVVMLPGRAPAVLDLIWQRLRATRACTPAWAWPTCDVETLPEPDYVAADPPPPSPKYRRLHQWFAAQRETDVDVDLAVLDALVDGGLPAAATTGKCAQEWWTNNPRKQHSRAWVNAGYAVTGHRGGATRRFVRGAKPMLTRAAAIEPRLNWLPHLALCPASAHRGDPFDRATSVYIIHLLDVELFKVGVSAADALSRRIRSHGAGGRRLEIVQTLTVAHRGCAHALEAAVLNLTEPDRRFDDRWRALAGGYSETWRDDGDVPDLRALAELMNPTIII